MLLGVYRSCSFLRKATMLLLKSGHEVGNPYTVLAVMLSAAKHLCAPRARSFAALSMTSEGSRQTLRCAQA